MYQLKKNRERKNLFKIEIYTEHCSKAFWKESINSTKISAVNDDTESTYTFTLIEFYSSYSEKCENIVRA